MDTPSTSGTSTTSTNAAPAHGKPAAQARRNAAIAQRERLIALYKTSGLSQKAFARREGVNYHTFVSWLAHSRLAAVPATRPNAPFPTPGFIEVRAPSLATLIRLLET